MLTFFQEIRTAAIRTLTALVHMECSPRYFEHSNLKHIKRFLQRVNKSARVMEICSMCSMCQEIIEFFNWTYKLETTQGDLEIPAYLWHK